MQYAMNQVYYKYKCYKSSLRLATILEKYFCAIVRRELYYRTKGRIKFWSYKASMKKRYIILDILLL